MKQTTIAGILPDGRRFSLESLPEISDLELVDSEKSGGEPITDDPEELRGLLTEEDFKSVPADLAVGGERLDGAVFGFYRQLEEVSTAYEQTRSMVSWEISLILPDGTEIKGDCDKDYYFDFFAGEDEVRAMADGCRDYDGEQSKEVFDAALRRLVEKVSAPIEAADLNLADNDLF